MNDFIRPTKHRNETVDDCVMDVVQNEHIQSVDCGLHSFMNRRELLDMLHHEIMYAPVTRIEGKDYE